MANLTRTDTINTGDLAVLYASNQGDYRGLPASELLAWLSANLNTPGAFVTQAVVVPVDGSTVTVQATESNIWLILNQTSDFPTMTIALPSNTALVDGQEILVFSTRQVLTLSFTLGGALAVNGAPASLAADDSFRLKYSKTFNAWYTVG